MDSKETEGKNLLARKEGFTLIEMAIVLIIIGIIIGAVVKGKDLVRSAEQKRIYTTWLREWQVAFNNYYDRTGWILGDTNSSDNLVGRNGQCSNPSALNIESQLTRVGLKAPANGPTGSSLVRTYTDSSGISRTLTMHFTYNANIGNYIAVQGIPNDLGMAWDRIIDGEMDGLNGDFLYSTSWNAPALAAWPSAVNPPVSANVAGILKLEF
jgi:prepilin-type N-terminal cleavage/methylation domain-containing protein